MSAINDGGPAFPHLHNTCQRVNESEMFPGMTLRDYFAAAALTGMSRLIEQGIPPEQAARDAWAYADALLSRLAPAPSPAASPAPAVDREGLAKVMRCVEFTHNAPLLSRFPWEELSAGQREIYFKRADAAIEFFKNGGAS